MRVGCCGFPCSRRKYFELFDVVELQNTFYELPTIEWAESLRKEAPQGFEFTLKAWQAITHPHSSPTWKKMKRPPSGSQENYGWLRPTPENFRALERTLEVARALGASLVILQTPASMPRDEDSAAWVKEFLCEASKVAKPVVLGWEPRGPWAEARDALSRIVSDCEIIHVADPFRYEILPNSFRTFYARLHGIGKGEVNYRYKYTDEDLSTLLEKVKANSTSFRRFYIMFNNVYMLDDAMRFKKMVASIS
ncbi:MAG: DUF72 domain-containing protein [Desulfurococcaceae archaeon]